MEASDLEYFKHTPLDQTSKSIRLLRVLPDLTETGLVQCDIWHDTIDADYTCLSYVWGAEADQRTICINGTVFICRNNLWDFLNVARIKHAADSKAFWIDAICIDQVNIPERNQQVRQMGDIYAKATEVVAWLGRDHGAVGFLKFLGRLATEEPQSEKDARRIWHRESTRRLRDSYLKFEANEYWTRAWITQEILQPEDFSILINDTQIRRPEFEVLRLLLPTLQSTVSNPERKSSDEFWRNTDRCFEIYVRVMAGYEMMYRRTAGWSVTVDKRLLDLLFFLGPRQCQVARDRVHSLLAIAEDAELVVVDYGMPEHTFIEALLRSHNQSLCLCSLARFADVYDCVEPFTTSAPHSLLIRLSMTASEANLGKRPTVGLTEVGKQLAKLKLLECAACDNEVLVDTVKEHIFCLRQVCEDTEGHLIVPKDLQTRESGETSAVKLVIPHKEGSPEHPLLRALPVNVLSLGLAEIAAEDILLRVMEPPLYSILLSFETLVSIALTVVEERRPLCQKAEKSLGGFVFVGKDGVGQHDERLD